MCVIVFLTALSCLISMKLSFQAFLTILVVTKSQYPGMFARIFVKKFSKMMRIQYNKDYCHIIIAKN